MDTNNKLILVAIGALLIGGLAGAHIGKSRVELKGMHEMSDGSMMHDTGMSMKNMMGEMNAELSGKTGDEFDKAFLSEMIMHHEGAVEMAEAALTNANHQEIKTMAKAIISAQNSEIAQMKKWLRTWYNQ